MISVIGALPAGIAATVTFACSVLQSSNPPPQIAPTTSWNLSLHVSGGYAGFDRELHVSSAGDLKAVDRRRKATANERVPPAALAQLDALVSKLSSRNSISNPDCRDCLRYHIELRTPQGSVVADLDDITIVGTQFEPVMRTLTTLLNSALSK